MGCRDDLYAAGAFIGCTGTIPNDPTVCFQNGNDCGHITRNHGIEENIGRETVDNDPNHAIGNEVIDGALRCVERTGPTDADIFHVGRSVFVPIANASAAQRSVLGRSLLNDTAEKRLRTMTCAEYLRAVGVPNVPVAAGRVPGLVQRYGG